MPHGLRRPGIVLALLLLPLAGEARAAERCTEVAGHVAAADPVVEVAAGPDWRPLGPGTPVCVGDVLRVRADQRAVLTLENGGGFVDLAPGTATRIVAVP